MARNLKRSGPLALRLLAVLCLLGLPRIGTAAGTWSVVSLPQQSGEVMAPTLVAADGAGNVYVADYSNGLQWSASPRIQKRDSQGHWSVLATYGTRHGQVRDVIALATDAAGNLYVLDTFISGNRGVYRLQRRDVQGPWSVISISAGNPVALSADAAGNLYLAGWGPSGDEIGMRDVQGHWTVIAKYGTGLGQVDTPTALAADAAGNLYVAETSAHGVPDRIQKRDTQGHWLVLATAGNNVGQVYYPTALAVDAAGNLYVLDGYNRIQKRDGRGNWALIADEGPYLGQANGTSALAVDAAGTLYVVDELPYGNGRVQQRDAQGHWSLLATRGEGSGQMIGPAALAVDRVGNLYVADQSEGNVFADEGQNRVQQRDPQGNWSVLAVLGPQAPLNPFFNPRPVSLAVDAMGSLYVADDSGHGSRIQQRDAQGHWSVIATSGYDLGQVHHPTALAADAAGNLYIAEARDEDPASRDAGRIQRRDAQGHWALIAAGGDDPGQVHYPTALAVDAAGNLYVAESADKGVPGIDDGNRIQERDVQGHWSVIAAGGSGSNGTSRPGQVVNPQGLAVDAAGSLYVSDDGSFGGTFNPVLETANRVQKRDVQGHWSSTNQDAAVGQFMIPGDLTVDGAGHLYVADNGNSRVLEYAPDGRP